MKCVKYSAQQIAKLITTQQDFATSGKKHNKAIDLNTNSIDL